MKRLWLWLPLAAFAGLVGIFLHGLMNPASNAIPSQWVGQPMPQFALAAAASNRPGFTSNDLTKGRARLVNIFASWCIPCAAEAPILASLAQQGVEIDGIALRDKREDLDGFLTRYGNPYVRIGSDFQSNVPIALGSTGVPETYVVDGSGIIRFQHIGELHVEDVPVLMAVLGTAK